MSFVCDTEKKARKSHRCCACGETIPVGFKYTYSFCVDGGDVIYDRWHNECREEFARVLRENYDESGDPYDTWEDGLPEELMVKYGLA